MLKRLGVIGIGCLISVPAMYGCSSGNNNATDAGTDSGPVPMDAGSDGGSTDSGTAPGALGAPCTAPTNTTQNCAGNLVCIGVTPSNMCSILGCQEAFDGGVSASNPCGVGAQGVPNVCVPFSRTDPANSACAPGCDPKKANSCARSGWSCWTQPDVSNVSCSADPDCQGGEHCVGGICSIAFCWPDCRTPDGACPYGATCEMTTGQCTTTDCSNASCPSGQLCYDNTAQNEKDCVAPCNTAGGSCPAAWSCGDAGFCEPQINSYGQTCGLGIAECDSKSQCVLFTTATDQNPQKGECLPTCVSDSECPMGSVCKLTLSNNQNVCTPPVCSTDAGQGCSNTGMQCESVQISQTILEMVCVPQ